MPGLTGYFGYGGWWQNAWTGGYISGSEIASLATVCLEKPLVAGHAEK